MTSESVAVASSRDEVPVYRAVSRAAVVSLVFAILSLAGMLAPSMLLLCLMGLLFGTIALKNIRRYPTELTGKKMAKAGIILSATLLLAGTALHVYIYATEVPEGYQRISFSLLQPSEDAPNSPCPRRSPNS